MEKSTQLRYIESKDKDKIVKYVSAYIPFKIEIKGSPIYVNGKWVLWFNLPESLHDGIPFGNIDKEVNNG